MVRATTNGVLNGYRYNLMRSMITDNNARNTVLTQRVFNSYAEDPASAAKAFRLRKSRLMTSSQLKICDDAYHKYQGAYASLQTVSQLIDTSNNGSQISTLKATTLEMLNDPSGDARTQLSKVLGELGDTIIQNMNQKYGDEFIFAGADGYNVPFTIEEDADGHKQLYYRGVPVDAAVPALMLDSDGETKLEVQVLDPTTGTPSSPDEPTYLREGAELMDSSAIPDLADDPNNAGTPLTVTGDDGNDYYVLDSAAGPMSETAFQSILKDAENAVIAANPGATQEEINAAVEAEKAKYVGITTTDAAGNETTKYYKTEDVILKSQYDSLNDSILRDENGNPYTVTITDEDGNDTTSYIVKGKNDPLITESEYNQTCSDAAKLEYLVNEKRFVDIGLGFQEDENGQLIESSAFNVALNGLTFLGYGLDEDGDPKNIYSIVQRLTEIADSVPEAGKWSNEVYDEFFRLVGKLEDASSEFKTQFTNQSASTEKLKNNYDLLEDNVYNLKEQYSNLEDVNMADAITSFIWAEYCYNAALKVGNSILSQSLMDYLM